MSEKRVCCIGDCGKPWHCRGLCCKHYGEWLRSRNAGHKVKVPRQPSRPPWQYENPAGEIELAEQFGGQS